MHSDNGPIVTGGRPLRVDAETVESTLKAQRDAWSAGSWTRRKFIAGAGMVGVAAMAGQLVTARAAYAAQPSSSDNTLVVIFLRGAADGLRILQPNSDELGSDYLHKARAALVLPETKLVALPNQQGWGLNAQLKPLYDALWPTGELGFVPACSSPGVSRSHFQAQQWLEAGGSDHASSGWLERALECMGPGTTFRAIAHGPARPQSLTGTAASLSFNTINEFQFPGWDSIRPQSQQAVLGLYRGLGGPLGEDVPDTLAAITSADPIRKLTSTNVKYPEGGFASQLKDLAQILRADVGLQVATVDLGGWDTHTNEAQDLDANLTYVGNSLRSFMDDLGPERRKRVTVAVMTEFGRRVSSNGSGGTDHGHGSLIWLLGGGLAGSGVFGKWTKLAAGTLDDGDVPGLNNPFDVLGELLTKRLHVASSANVFVNHAQSDLGIAVSA